MEFTDTHTHTVAFIGPHRSATDLFFGKDYHRKEYKIGGEKQKMHNVSVFIKYYCKNLAL